MGAGFIVAKDGATIEDSTDKLYVDDKTGLFKVMKNANGALVINNDGTFSSLGQWNWVFESSGGFSNIYSVLIPYNDNINYIPQFEAFMDNIPNDKRFRLTNFVTGVATSGKCSATVQGQTAGIKVFASVSKDLTNKPFPGTYGYYVQIYYDRVTKK